MKLYIDGRAIPVKWEQNESVRELTDEVQEKSITVAMAMYGGGEQFGFLGRAISHNDRKITADCGDIALCCGDQIVVCYGSNTWAYTRLGKMELTRTEITDLLSRKDVTLILGK